VPECRRIKFAAESIKARGGLVTKSSIERTASLGIKALRMPTVQRAIAEAQDELEKSFPSGSQKGTGNRRSFDRVAHLK